MELGWHIVDVRYQGWISTFGNNILKELHMTVLKEQICPKYSGSTDGRTREEEEEKEEEQETHVFRKS